MAPSTQPSTDLVKRAARQWLWLQSLAQDTAHTLGGPLRTSGVGALNVFLVLYDLEQEAV